MASKRDLTLVLLAGGSILLFQGYESSQSLRDQVTETVTGRYADFTTSYLILGAVAAAAGIGLLVFNKSGIH